MNQIDMHKLLKTLGVLVLLFAMVGVMTHFRRKNSMTLDDYAKLHPSQAAENEPEDNTDNTEGMDQDAMDRETDTADENLSETPTDPSPASVTTSALTGALLNGGADGQAMLEQRVTYPSDIMDAALADFYYEPLSVNLQRYITGISYPSGVANDLDREGTDEAGQNNIAPYADLRYVHILHYDLTGTPVEGELVCNAAIAWDLVEIFYELYRNEYQIEKVLLPEEYDGDMTASAGDNNSFCFNGAGAEDLDATDIFARGLALNINPLYNPRVSYGEDGSQIVFPAEALQYADRDTDFAYKIDEDDLCYKLFTRYGFVWGGNRNAGKNYGLFQKKDF